jgi:drug/metabolite transporter (DMT)-like permease
MFTKADAEAYFMAEKQESLLFTGIGIAAIIAALVCWFVFRTPVAKGIAIPLVAVAIIQCVVGYTVYSRSDAQRKDIVYKMDLNPGAISAAEIPRMEKVMQNFVIYRWVELALLFGGIGMVIVFRNNDTRQMLYGIGIGFAIQSSLMLAADYFAEKRGHQYLTGLQAWAKSPGR